MAFAVQVRMVSAPDFSACAVEIGNVTSYMVRGSKLAPLFGLIFRRSACQHPLLAGALGESSMILLQCTFWQQPLIP